MGYLETMHRIRQSQGMLRVQLQFRALTWHADTTIIRLIMAAASIVYALLFQFAPAGHFAPVSDLITQLFPKWLWSTLFLVHGIGVAWRFFDHKERIAAALVINVLGFLIWSSYVFLNILGLGYMSSGIALETIMCICLFWSLVRTGLKEEVASP